MRKKNRLLMMAILYLTSSAYAVSRVETVVLYTLDGKKAIYSLDERPKVEYFDDCVVLSTSSTLVEYSLANLHKLVFEGGHIDTDELIFEEKKENILLEEDLLILSGLDVKDIVVIYTLTGLKQQSYPVVGNGTVYVPLSSLPYGTYIIKANSMTFKLLKK